MLRLTKRYRFSASHRLHSDQLSEQENKRLFGKCSNPFGHGHNYVLEVGVRGEADPLSGLLASREALDRLVERAVLRKVEHADLNHDVPEFNGVVPTTENLTLLIHRWLERAWEEEFAPGKARLARVRVEETARNSFEVSDSYEFSA